MGFIGAAVDYVGGNSKLVDNTEFETEIRKSDPRLLQQDETIVFAFKDRVAKDAIAACSPTNGI